MKTILSLTKTAALIAFGAALVSPAWRDTCLEWLHRATADGSALQGAVDRVAHLF